MPDFGHDIEFDRAAALERIRLGSALLRGRFVTDLPGQEIIYGKKEAEAARYLADPAPDLALYRWIPREVGSTAPTAYEVAQVISNLAARWEVVGSDFEEIRLGAIAAAETATTAADLGAICDGFDADLAAFVAGLSA